MTNVIEFSHVTKRYGKTTALDDLSFSVKEGELVAFLGPNGSGKTTTIKLLTGIIDADAGSISVGGYDIAKQPLKAKSTVGYISDNPDIFLRLKGAEYLDFIGDVYGVGQEDRKLRIEELAARFEMTDALREPIFNYSHGMRQKLAVIAALLHKPKIWILDEPMTGLDPKSAFELKKLMREHVENGNSVFYSTHVLEVAEKLCDRVLVIRKGKLLYDGSLESLEQVREGTLEDIFLTITEENN